VSKLCGKEKGKKVEFCLREITQGSKKKTYGPYLGHVEKLAKPIELKGRVIERKPVALLKPKSSAKKGGMRGGENSIDKITVSFDDPQHIILKFKRNTLKLSYNKVNHNLIVTYISYSETNKQNYELKNFDIVVFESLIGLLTDYSNCPIEIDNLNGLIKKIIVFIQNNWNKLEDCDSITQFLDKLLQEKSQRNFHTERRNNKINNNLNLREKLGVSSLNKINEKTQQRLMRNIMNGLPIEPIKQYNRKYDELNTINENN